MQESARTALSYVRSRAEVFNIDPQLFNSSDIHIHVPAGAQPKDGPSAGIAIVTALVSLLTKRVVKSDVAMTGEISLRGQVLPVGGIKEKSLAAHRAGIKTVIIPKENKPDLEELPEEVLETINFIPVEYVEDVINKSLEIPKKTQIAKSDRNIFERNTH